MNILYLECSMGAAGDMLLSALTELLPHPDSFITKLNNLGIPNVKISKETVSKCGISGTHLIVKIRDEEEGENEPHHSHSHHHSSESDYNKIILDLPVSDKVKKDSAALYSLLAEAESKIHNVPVDMVHFHEVGAMDAVADIVGVCMAIEELNPDKIVCSPISVGYGHVKCAHGILPVPAPATALLLKEIPIQSGNIEGELCTPTGAALIKYFASEFSVMPLMKVDSIGYGAGKKDFSAANILRIFKGNTAF